MGFKNWQMKGLSMVENLHEGTLKTFQQLVTKYHLPKKTKWEAFKAYIRGEIMSYTRRKSKEYYKKLGDLDHWNWK